MERIIEPKTKMLTVRGIRVELSAMGKDALIDWAEIQILCGRKKAEALELSRMGKEEDVRRAVTLLVHAEDALCIRAGVPEPLTVELSSEEKLAVIAAQDELNRLDLMTPFLALQHQALAAHLGADKTG